MIRSLVRKWLGFDDLKIIQRCESRQKVLTEKMNILQTRQVNILNRVQRLENSTDE